ncbi:MAG: MFS transporter [Proteobacteria bacterium]|nr:MFS transporter [Pseudomonadota bacterium]
MTASASPYAKPLPATLIVAAGCIIAMLTFGPRSALGFFQQPIIQANGWGRDVFSLALAFQNLLWGMGQPFMGALADRFGTLRILWCGILLYAAGLYGMTLSTDPMGLNLSAGVLIGFGLSGSSFNLVLAAFGKLLPPEKRAMGFGFGTAAGSFGQFLFSPLGVGLIRDYGWQGALTIFAALMLVALPLALAVATRPMKPASAAEPANEAEKQSIAQALAEAFRHRSYVFLVLGFFTCGFQLAFVTIHLPSYFKDISMPASAGALTMALVGAFNMIGSLAAGWASTRMPKRWLLAAIYFGRSIVTLLFLASVPYVGVPLNVFGIETSVGIVSAMLFGAFTGLLWLSTVPPTAALVTLMFGPRYLAMLYGFAFFSHQVGGFLGVWLGGYLFEKTGSYDVVWWLSIGLGVASALINLPIVEKPAPGRAPELKPA